MTALLLFLYQALACAGFVLASPILLWRAQRHGAEMRERLGRVRPGEAQRGALWIHAASLGEMEGLRSLLADPRARELPPFVVTALSVSGRPRAGLVAPEAAWTGFAPLDLFFAVEPFLDSFRPRGLLLLETELWPWTLASCRRRGIPVAVISARLSPGKWSRTRLLRPVLRGLVSRLAGIAAQSEADAARFAVLGATGVEVTGNLKYRLEPLAGKELHAREEAPLPGAVPPERSVPTLPGRPPEELPSEPSEDALLWVVLGSLRRGEEPLLSALAGVRAFVVVAPRHLRERDAWIEECERRGIPVRSRRELTLEVPAAARLRCPEERAAFRSSVLRACAASAAASGSASASALASASVSDVGPGTASPASDSGSGPLPAEPPAPFLLLDVHGELASWYAAADLAFVGGTLAPIGGHNLFEPAREGIPVAFGPHTEGVADLAEPLQRTGGGVRVETARDFRAWTDELLADPASRERAGRAALAAAREVAGAGERTWAFLDRFPWVRRQTGAGPRPGSA